jgi:hypothetical protein
MPEPVFVNLVRSPGILVLRFLCSINVYKYKLRLHKLAEWTPWNRFLASLKVPKHEIFLTELIILSYPIWIGDLGSTAKN